MTFKDQLTLDLGCFFNTDEFAITATYLPQDGLATSITVVLDGQNATLQDPVPAGDTMAIFVKASEVDKPQYRDQFIINDETWYFRRNLSGGANDGIYELEISRSERRPI